VLASSNVAANHEPKPHDVPVGVVGTPEVVRGVAASLREKAPGAYEVHGYDSLGAARTAVLHRDVYGAFQPAPTPTLLVASAGGPAVATLLENTFEPAARQRGQSLIVRDLVPLPSSDSRGATSFSMIISLLIAGIMGSAIIYVLGQHRPPLFRLAVMVTLGISAGLVATFVTNVVVGAFDGHFLGVWGVASLFVLAVGLPIVAFQLFFGIAGTAIGAVMFLVVGNPASGGSSAPELLPGFWRLVSQLLPPGAAITAMRDVVYFHGHDMGPALLVLAAYAVIGAVVAFTVSTARARREAAAGAS
jgi:hypothetical protein